jgi:thiamine-phosphate pyrophosphorylase
MTPPGPPFSPGLYAILDLDTLAQRGHADPRRAAEALIRGGSVALQLRAKGRSRDGVRPLAEDLRQLAREASIPFYVNDDIQLAAEVDADGVHLGQHDGAVAHARSLLRPHQQVGRSTHDLDQLREAAASPAAYTYLGFGPVYPTRTKADADPVQGLQILAEACAAASLPVVAIGGVDLHRAAAVAAAGAHAAAAISAVLGASDLEATARRFTDAFGQARRSC